MKAQTMLIIPFSLTGIDFRTGLDKSVSCAGVSLSFKVSSLPEQSQVIPCPCNSAVAVAIKLFGR